MCMLQLASACVELLLSLLHHLRLVGIDWSRFLSAQLISSIASVLLTEFPGRALFWHISLYLYIKMLIGSDYQRLEHLASP